MKILYVTRGRNIDYMNDLLFHGLYSLYGDDVVDSRCLWYLYPEHLPRYKKKRLYGRGFSICESIPKDMVDRSDIEAKIKNQFYDLVIYGQPHRCINYLELVLKHYPRNKIAFIDGEDATFNLGSLFRDEFIYFKRELNHPPHKHCFPISFAFVKDRIVSDVANIRKTKKFGTVVPGDLKTYKFKREQPYYEDYQQSYFGKTWKKAGWDCMRHYEILANYCLPHFVDLADCPQYTMTNYPKQLGLQANQLAASDHFDEGCYYELLEETFDYFKSHMTTEHLAKYVLSKIQSV